MKIKTLLLSLLTVFSTIVATAQVESGKVYRIVNKQYGTVAFEKVADHTVGCAKAGTITDYNQLWIITETGVESCYTIQNVYTGRNLGFQNGTNVPFYTTPSTSYYLFINDNSTYFNGCYTITSTKGSNWAMHCNSSGTCVPWNASAEATNWTFEEVSITAEEIAEARTIYQNFTSVVDNALNIAYAFEPFFEDKACTILKAEYAAMSDADLQSAMDAASIPADLQAVALKVKNNTWDSVTREKEFRIYDYKPYSNPNKWVNILYTRLYSPIDNPTGICSADDKSYTYVFVDTIPEGSTIELAEMSGTGYFGTNTPLRKGLNIVPAAQRDGVIYVRYICDTDTAGKKLADYPAVKIHIENGYVNGFWSKERGHTNADWTYMKNNMFKNEDAIQAKGDFTLLDFRKREFLAACPEKISEVMTLWDYWNKTQQKFMNLDKYYSWFNNLQLAMSDDNGFMDAGNHRTHYNNNTLSTIVNYEVISTDAGSSWGPNHEIGHNNQYAFEIVGTSEVSNNALANMVIFTVGTHTSRGQNMTNQIVDFENKVPYVVRGESAYGSKLFSMTRMYFQLFLYTYAAGKHPDFYPQLFERLRYDRLVGWSTGARDELDENGYYIGSMNALNDQLKFAEVCCEILQMDLSEFFEAWGFFIPMKNAFVGDYGHHYVYLHQADIDASKARMQKYEKKGGHLMFLEDRIRPSKYIVNEELNAKLDLIGGLKDNEYIKNGYRANYANWDGERIGDVGDFGQWEDYIDESVKAQGYYYTNVNGKIMIKEDTGAKGALGFKMYNAETGELLTFTNKKSMTIPAMHVGAELRIVAAQADGTDYIVPNASEGPEEMQYETLSASIKNASYIINNIASSNNEVGKYFTDYVSELETVYAAAKAAYDNKDTSEHSYAEWSGMLDDEYNKVVNNEKARVTIKEGNVYYMFNGHYSLASNYLTWAETGLIGQISNPTLGTYQDDADKHWTFEYAGTPGDYYIKNENGYYISSIALNSDIYAMSKYTSSAIVFNVNYSNDGRTFFTTKNNSSISIGLNKLGGNALGMSPSEAKARWAVRVLEDKALEFETATLNELVAKAKKTLIEVTDTIELAKGDTVLLNKNVYSNDILLQDYITDLYNDYTSVDWENTDSYYNYITELRVSLKNIEGKYNVVSPTETNDSNIKWYVIRSKSTGKVWSVNATNQRVSLVAAANEEAITDDMLWAIIPVNKYGGYKIINKSYEMCVYRFRNATNGREQNYYMVAEFDDVDYRTITFEYDIDEKAAIIYTGIDATKGTLSKAVDTGGANLSYNTTTTTSMWTFEFHSVVKNEELYEKFAEIKDVEETLPGDVDGDGEVLVADVTAVVAMILGDVETTAAADVDGDGELTVADATALVTIILGKDTASAAPAKAAATRAGEVSTVSADGDGSTLLININNPGYPFSAIQFDLELPEGIEVDFDGEYYAVDLGSRTNSRKHSYPECAIQPDGSLRVVIISMSNALYNGTEGDVATAALKVNGAADGDYRFTIKNVVLSAPGSKEKLEPYTGWINVTGGVTGIDEITADGAATDGAIYDLQGRKVSNPTKGVYIINGKKVIY